MGDSLAEIDLGLSPSGNSTAFAIAVTTGQQFTCVLVEGGGVKVSHLGPVFYVEGLPRDGYSHFDFRGHKSERR